MRTDFAKVFKGDFVPLKITRQLGKLKLSLPY